MIVIGMSKIVAVLEKKSCSEKIYGCPSINSVLVLDHFLEYSRGLTKPRRVKGALNIR
jgi:hypothetical protein